MGSNLFRKKMSSLRGIRGYQKPERYPDVLRLDTNENMALSRSFVSRILVEAARRTDPREYPSEQFDELRHRYSKYLGVPEACIAAGSGSDQIIDLLLATFNGRGSRTVTIDPTFAFFIDRCNLHSVRLKKVRLGNDFALDAGKILAESNADICYICSPNNPTGNQFGRKDLREIAGSFGGLVIVDEAYADFADYSLKDLVRKHENLVVLRTMSKAFGLAGARVGLMVANRDLAEIFARTVQYPYPVSSVSLRAASIALSRAGYFRSVIRQVRRERERIQKTINSFVGLHAFRSDANFVLFGAGSASKARSIFRGLIRRGILVREIGNIGSHKGCLRVTVGTSTMNSRFLDALEEVAAR